MAILAYDETMLREPRLLVPKLAPLGPVRIDWANTITRNLKFCILCGDGLDVVNNVRASSMSGVRNNSGPGRGWQFAQNQDMQFAHRASYNIVNQLTLFSMFNCSRSDGAWYDPLLIKTNAGANQPFEWRASLNSSNARKCVLSRADAVNFRYINFNETWTAGALTTASVSTTNCGFLEIWGFLNGAPVTFAASVGAASGDATPNTNPLYVAQRPDGVTDFDGVQYLHIGWERVLSLEEHRDLHKNPYQFLIPA